MVDRLLDRLDHLRLAVIVRHMRQGENRRFLLSPFSFDIAILLGCGYMMGWWDTLRVDEDGCEVVAIRRSLAEIWTKGGRYLRNE